MICHPYRGKPPLFGAPRHSEDALDIYWFAIMRHAYTKFHGVSPSLCAVATTLRRPFLQKGPPPHTGFALFSGTILWYLIQTTEDSYTCRPPSETREGKDGGENKRPT